MFYSHNDLKLLFLLFEQIYSTQFSLLCRYDIKNMPFLGKSHLMNIILNGQNKKIDDNTNIEKLLISLNLDNKRLAVEVNQEIIPRADFDSFTLSELDKVEIVQAIGGGSYAL